jgi:hypothetical protein
MKKLPPNRPFGIKGYMGKPKEKEAAKCIIQKLIYIKNIIFDNSFFLGAKLLNLIITVFGFDYKHKS